MAGGEKPKDALAGLAKELAEKLHLSLAPHFNTRLSTNRAFHHKLRELLAYGAVQSARGHNDSIDAVRLSFFSRHRGPNRRDELAGFVRIKISDRFAGKEGYPAHYQVQVIAVAPMEKRQAVLGGAREAANFLSENKARILEVNEGSKLEVLEPRFEMLRRKWK